MTQDDEKQLSEYEAWIADNHPEHDRTSCDDNNLHNAGSVTLRHRCDRCESLKQLKAWKNERLVGSAVGLAILAIEESQPPETTPWNCVDAIRKKFAMAANAELRG